MPGAVGRIGNYPVPSTTYAVRANPPYIDPRLVGEGLARADHAVRNILDATSAAVNEAEYIGNKLYDSGNEVLRNLPGVGAGFRTNEDTDFGRRAGKLLMEYIDRMTGGNLPYRERDFHVGPGVREVVPSIKRDFHVGPRGYFERQD